MIHNIADGDRRQMALMLYAASNGRLIEGEQIWSRPAGSTIFNPVNQHIARNLIELGWVKRDDNHMDERGRVPLYVTPDGHEASRKLRAWCQANPIRR